MNQQRRTTWVLGLGLSVVTLMGYLGLSRAVAQEEPALSSTTPSLARPLRFAVIGDYGENDAGARSVGDLVTGWRPEFITTVGDNNYPSGRADTIDANIGQYYHEYIYPYMGAYTSTTPIVARNRFWPALGNHDWSSLTCVGTACTGPYFDYFTLPGNERYYDLVRGPVHFFFVDSDKREPEGITRDSAQAAWLQAGLAASQTPWQLVLMHHIPYGSGINNGPDQRLQWPFKEWGADAVLTGHEHVYERLIVDGLPYIVNGLGGKDRRQFREPRPCSEVRYNERFGALLVEATAMTMTFQFINVAHELVDTQRLPAPATREVCLSTYVKEGADDVEQTEITGTVSSDGRDLELTMDIANNHNQVVGIRFQQVAIPPGANILAAMLEFHNRKDHDEPTSLLIHGVAADHAPVFGPEPFALSTLPQTTASVTWDHVVPWLTLGYPEPSPDISAILQEIVDRPGWRSGNAVSFIISGSGVRNTHAYEDEPDRVVGLVFKYERPVNGSSGLTQFLPIIRQ